MQPKTKQVEITLKAQKGSGKALPGFTKEVTVKVNSIHLVPGQIITMVFQCMAFSDRWMVYNFYQTERLYYQVMTEAEMLQIFDLGNFDFENYMEGWHKYYSTIKK